MDNKELTLTTENEAGIDVVRQMTGEFGINDNPNKLKWINFSGKEGKYTIKDNDEVKEIGVDGLSITGTIFKVTKKVQSDMESEHNVRSDEFSDMGNITIIDDVTKEVKETGAYEDLKVKYDLKLLNILYMYVEELGIYAKLQIGGSSLGNLWDYLGSFGSKDTVARYTTKFGVDSGEFVTKKGMKVTYYKTTFTRGELVPQERLQGILGELSKVNLHLSSGVQSKLDSTNEVDTVSIEEVPFN